jgi:Rrf2 family protein
MKFTAKTEYGVRAMLEIAIKEGRPAKVNEIAAKQNIPERFLERIMAELKTAKLIKSIRGAHGGYVLKYPAEKITLAKIIQALEGPMALVDCLENDNSCCQIELCTIKDVWRGVQSVILEALDSITLKQLIGKNDRRRYVKSLSQ